MAPIYLPDVIDRCATRERAVMMGPEDEFYIERRTSCTRDEAAAKMMGWLQGSLRRGFFLVDRKGISLDQMPNAPSLDGKLLDYLEGLRAAAQRDLLEAAEKRDMGSIYENEEAMERLEALINKASEYLSMIDGELAKEEKSRLIIDKRATAEFGEDHITLSSLDQWSRETYKIPILATGPLAGNVAEAQVLPLAEDKPWLKLSQGDPLPELPWYTPARYFARKVVEEDPALLRKRDVLAKKVTEYLTSAGIKKRGGVKPFDPGTVKKALVKVKLG